MPKEANPLNPMPASKVPKRWSRPARMPNAVIWKDGNVLVLLTVSSTQERMWYPGAVVMPAANPEYRVTCGRLR